ncbi:MAG: hypothetical protein RIE73_11350 [Coleofasciculus sp. C1-SOL-03]|uniref:hypothetical protein n=1 Tax=Coleofasciculus sp. C1-SOL-03 TaxID=3069522 RepID=UPI0032F0E48B
MKIILLSLTLLFLIFGFSPAQAENLPTLAQNGVEVQQLSKSPLKPLKSYFLNVLGGGSRQSIKLDSPATRLIIYVQRGEKPIRCGDCTKTYNCIPGKPLKINVDPATPIKKIWAENRYEKLVRLRLDVLEEVSNPEPESRNQS